MSGKKKLAYLIGWISLFLWSATYGIETPQLVVQIGHGDAIEAVAFSSDGRLLASGSGDSTVKLWDVVQGRELRTLIGHQGHVRSVRFSPDGHTVVSADDNQTVKFWNVLNGQELRTITEAGDIVAFSRDGRMLASAGALEIIKLWDVKSGKELHSMSGHQGAIHSVAVSPDGRVVASASMDKTVKLWDVVGGKLLRTLNGHDDAVNAVAFSTNGRMLVSGSKDKTIRLWDVASGKALRIISGQGDEIASIALAADGRTLAAAGMMTIKLWDLANGKEIRTFSKQDQSVQDLVTSVAFSPDARTLVSAHFGVGLDASKLQLWDVASGKYARSFSGHGDNVNRAVLSPDGRTLVSGSWDGTLNWWDLGTGTAKRVPMPGGIYAADFSKDGKLFASGSGYEIKLWDALSSAHAHVRTMSGHTGYVHSLTFSPDRNIIASASEDETIRLWDLATGKELRKLTGHKGYVNSVVFSPDGKTLASGGDDETIKIWDVATGKNLLTLEGHTSWVRSVVFSTDGRLLASASYDRQVKIWDLAGAKVLRTLEGHTESVNDVAFSPDGKLLASASHDHSVKLWDVATGVELHNLRAHQNWVNSVRFSADGKLLISGSRDGTIRIWRVDGGAYLAALVSFTDASWAIMGSDGRFDTADLEQMQGLHWVMPDAPLNAVPIEIFMRDYYEPRLLPRILKGEKFKPIRKLDTLNRLQAKVDILEVKPEPGKTTVTVTVRVETPKVTAGSSVRQSAAHDLKLFRDGQLVGSAPQNDGALALDKNGQAQIKFSGIQLAHGEQNHTVDFSVYAFNSDRVKSSTVHKSYEVPANAAMPAKHRAYLLVIGVNAYDNPLLDLNYAVNDAVSIQQVLEKRLLQRGDFDEVVTIPLISLVTVKQGGAHGVASKGNIKAVLDLLAGRKLTPQQRALIPNADKLQKAMPDDAVFISFSGHGYYETGGDFYLLPSDIGTSPSIDPTDAILAASISSAELTQWLRDVDGGEMSMIIDACHSSAAVGADFKPGPMGSRGLGQLAFDKGMKILAATQADNVAMEAEELEHGYLSYALVQEGLLANKGDFKPQDGRITMSEWLGFAAQRVPYLAQEVDNGTISRQLARSVKALKRDVGGQSSNQLEDDVQQPTLFEFKRNQNRNELVIQ